MVDCMEDLPGLLFKAVFGLPGWIGQGPDFKEDFKGLSRFVLFLAGKLYVPALL